MSASKHAYLFAKDANIGEDKRSPTINADDRRPSLKLFKSKSPLQAPMHHTIMKLWVW